MDIVIYFLMFIFILCLLCLTICVYHVVKRKNTPEHFEKQIDDSTCQVNCTEDTDTKSKNNRVLIVSCYGYGNMGDNMYAEIFTKYLPECEIVKISDHSVFVDSKKQIVWQVPEKDYQFDFLIIGGGGLLTAKKLRDSKNMPHYIDLAKKRNKPLFIISCGVQGSLVNFNYEFKLWKDALNYAKLITVRSKKDKELLDGLVTNSNKIHYFRDLGYIFPHTLRPYKNFSKTITLIVAGPIHDKNETIIKTIKDKKLGVVIMNMGSLKDDDNNRRIIKMDFPGVNNIVKYYGCGKAPEFSPYDSVMVNQNEMEEILKHNPEVEKINPSDLTLNKVVNVIYNSALVYTGRYHGMVFSRSLGIPYDTLDMGTNKVKWEEPIKEGKNGILEAVLNSYNNIKMLRKEMNLSDVSEYDIFNIKSSVMSL